MSTDNEKILCDAAMGTSLISQGFPANSCLEALNLTAAETVRAVHAAHFAAGSRLLLTHTFGMNPLRLAQHGLADQLEEIARAAVQNARWGASPSTLVYGDVGPSGLKPDEIAGQGEALRQGFTATIAALVQNHVDGLWLETFTSLDETRIALQALQDLHLQGMPVIVTLSPQADGRLTDGTPEAVWMPWLQAQSVTGIGLNCVAAVENSIQMISRLWESGTKPLALKAHGGLPGSPTPPAEFALFAKTCLEQVPLRWLGGCCGTTPDHVRALADLLTSRSA